MSDSFHVMDCFAAMMVNGQADGDLRLTGFESSRLAGTLEMNFLANGTTSEMICSLCARLLWSADNLDWGTLCGFSIKIQMDPIRHQPVIHLLAGWSFVTMVFD